MLSLQGTSTGRVSRTGTVVGGLYSSAEVLAALLTHRTEVFRYELHRIVSGAWTVVADVTDLIHSCTITYEASATNFMRSAKMEIVDDAAVINFLTDAIRCFHLVRMPDGNYVEWMKGTFYVPSPGTPFDEPMTHEVTTEDALRNLRDSKITDLFQVPSTPPGGGFDPGDPIGWAYSLILSRYPLAGVDLHGPTSVRVPTATPKFYPPGTPILDVVNDLLLYCGWAALRADVTGSYISQQFVNPSARPLEFTYIANESSILVRKRGRGRQDWWNAFNQVLRYVSDPSINPPLRSRRTITDPTNILSTTYRGRTVTDSLAVSAPDQATLDLMTAALYELMQRRTRSTFVSTPLMPHDHEDIVALNYPTQPWNAQGNGIYMSRKWTFPMVPGGRMEHELEFAVTTAPVTLGSSTGLGAGGDAPLPTPIPIQGTYAASRYGAGGSRFTFSAVAAGRAGISGHSAVSFTWSDAETGRAGTEAVVASSFTWSAAAVGSVPAAITGTLASAFTFSDFAQGGDAMIKIDEQVLGVDTASFDFTSISGAYSHLRLVIQARGTKAATSDTTRLRFNNDSTAIYDTEQLYGSGAVSASVGQELAQTSALCGDCAAANAPANVADGIVIDIPNYARTTFEKTAHVTNAGKLTTASGGLFAERETLWWRSTAAINRITLFPAGGNWKAGSVATLYGLL